MPPSVAPRALSKDRAELLRRLLAKEVAPLRSLDDPPREAVADTTRAPASWEQRRLWFLHQLEVGARPIWHIQLCARLHGVLDGAALRAALSALAVRHDVLRTHFVVEHGEPSQRVAPDARLALTEVDLTELEASQRESRVASHKAREAEQPFDLLRGPLVRGRLLRVGSEEHVLLVTMHHLIADGWSLGVFLEDFAELYAAHHQQRCPRLPSLPLQYADYARWQQRQPADQHEHDVAYWRDRLSGAPPLLDLPTDHPRPERPSHRGRRATVLLDASLSDAIRATAQRHEVSPFMVVQAAWVVLLSHLSGQRDVVIGTPVANRPKRELERLIGLFINTLALRVSLAAETTIDALLAQVREVILGAFEHQQTPFEKIVEALQPARSLAHHPVFQVMMMAGSAPLDEVRLPGICLRLEEGVNRHALFDLMLTIEDRRAQIMLDLDYAADLFQDETIDGWLTCVVGVLTEITADASRPIASLFALPALDALSVRTPRSLLESLPGTSVEAVGSSTYEAPSGPLERELAIIWQALLSVERVGRDDNFFDLEGHSLLALKLLSRIEQAFGRKLDVTDVYRHPTLRSLAACIHDGRPEASRAANAYVDLATEARLDPSVRRHDASIPVARAANVLLTGATGFVGRFLLAELLQKTDATVYCIVRSSSPREASARVHATLSKWDLWDDAWKARIVPIAGDLRLPRLGLSGRDHALLCREVDDIHHCGTSMNHLETYAMARAANVESAREILKLACEGRPKCIHYVSTLGVFRAEGMPSVRVVHEATPIEGERHPDSDGYLSSKWVAEKLFMTGAERGIPCNIFRLGFVWADAGRGRYDALQREYRVFKSCLLSGLGIEDYRYEMPATPVDYVARAVVALAGRYRSGTGVFHLSASEAMTEGLFERANRVAGTALRLLPQEAWVREMQRLHRSGTTLPVVPLLDSAFAATDPECVRFDCARTHHELAQEGIAVPPFDDALLHAFVQTMRLKDEALQT